MKALEQHLQTLEEKLLRPETRSSAAELTSLLADDFTEFGSSGRVYDRAQIIDALRTETPVQRSIADFKALRLADNVVLVTYRATRDGTAGESPVTSLRASIWKLIDGRWKMAFHQGTLTKAQ